MLHTWTDKMADPILLQIFAADYGNSTFFIWKEIHKMLIIGSNESWK